MNLGQYINKLLFENETVIIPGFGAFISKYKPAVIHEETGEITPPSKEILFNQHIRNNDGLLVNFIAENDSLSNAEAQKCVEMERENIVYQLDKGEKITLDEIGVLFLNEKNEIQFEPQIDKNLLLDSFGLEPFNPWEEVPEIPEDETIENESSGLSKDVVEVQEDSAEIADGNPKDELIINESSEISSEIFEEEKTNLKAEPVFESAVSAIPNVNKKTNRLWFLLLIPLIIAVVFMIGNKPGKENVHEPIQNNGITEEVPKDDTTVDSTEITTADSAQIEEPELNTTTTLPTDSVRFYLVGGSFKEEENAHKFMGQFDVEGFEPFYLGKIGNFYCVGIGRYTTIGEAYQAKNDFMEINPDSETWIYERQ